MHYKTIMLEMLNEQPEFARRLKAERQMLKAVNHYALLLKSMHQSWKDMLAEQHPGRNEIMIASQAMELAVEEIQEHLRYASGTPERLEHSITRLIEDHRNLLPAE